MSRHVWMKGSCRGKKSANSPRHQSGGLRLLERDTKLRDAGQGRRRRQGRGHSIQTLGSVLRVHRRIDLVPGKKAYPVPQGTLCLPTTRVSTGTGVMDTYACRISFCRVPPSEPCHQYAESATYSCARENDNRPLRSICACPTRSWDPGLTPIAEESVEFLEARKSWLKTSRSAEEHLLSRRRAHRGRRRDEVCGRCPQHEKTAPLHRVNAARLNSESGKSGFFREGS